MFEILEKERYEEYEEFAKHHKNGSFTQSAYWAEVKRNWGQAVLVSRDAKGRIRGGLSILTQELEGYDKHFLYAPRGPVMDYDDEETFLDLINGVRELAGWLPAFHFKMDPMVLASDQHFIDMARRSGFTWNPMAGDADTIQRRCNYMIYLTKFSGDKEALYSSFHPKWRYNIRVAQRKGVVCRSCGKVGLRDFERIYQETARRDHFLARPESYFHGFLDALAGHARLYMCYYEGKPLAGAICTNYAGRTSFVYGASSGEERNRMPNYLLQWTMMQWAMETGCRIYDFQGIPIEEGMNVSKTGGKGPDDTKAEAQKANDSMQGVYRFKKGFHGEPVLFAGEFDLVFDSDVKRASDVEREKLAERKRRLKEEEKAIATG